MPLLPNRAATSCADILSTCQSAEDASNLVRGIVKLKEALREEKASRFVDSVFQIGSNQFQQLLKDPDLEETYRRVFTRSRSSTQRPLPIVENTDNHLPGARPSVPSAPAVSGAGNLCECPPRKAPYKTVRGLREHLMIKHGLSQVEAESEAQRVFARLQAMSQHHARYDSQGFSPPRDYTNEGWDVQYEEFGLDGVVADQVALPGWEARS